MSIQATRPRQRVVQGAETRATIGGREFQEWEVVAIFGGIFAGGVLVGASLT